MRSPESMAIENVSVDEAYRKAQKTLGRSEIDIEDFVGIGEFSVDKDREYVEKMEAKFAERIDPGMEHTGKLAVVFEAIFNDHAELSNWLGPSVFMIKTSRFDDIKNGVDSVAEFQEGEGPASHLALAIDVTTSSYTVREKLEKIKREIECGKLTEVKYFKSEHEKTRGSLSKIPRVIVGADAETIKNLSNLWLSGDNKALASHSVQFQVLEEILLQLRAFSSYAMEVNQPEIAGTYNGMYKIVDSIYEEKVSSVDDTEERDSAFYAIKKHVGNFSK